MGQAASLYAIDKIDFSKVVDNPFDFGLQSLKKFSVVFEKTFEGLKFVLAKNQTVENQALVEQIFYPFTTLGETIDFETIDFDNLDPDIDLLEQPVYYNEPEVVKNIATFLNNFSTEQFANNFNYVELNEQEIYPEGVWNNSNQPNIAFNLNNTIPEFLELKKFYNLANETNCYVLSYVD